MSLSEYFKQSSDLIIEKIDDVYLIMLNDTEGKGIYLTEVAALIFEMCDGKTSVEQIGAAIVREYDVSPDECMDDILHCIDDLLIQKIIQRC